MGKPEDTLISIIIPVYNMESYVERCLDSLLSQDYYNLQIIVIDDGSSDKSGVICDGYAVRDSRIEVYHEKNGGSVSARKIGLKHVRGKYVGFVDADDYVDSNMFSLMLAVMEEYDADFVHTGYKEVNDIGVLQRINFMEGLHVLYASDEKKEFIKKYILDIKSERTISYSIWSKLFKTDLILKCFNELNDEQQIGEDAICLCRCVMESQKIYFLPIALYNYQVRKSSLSHDSGEILFPKQITFLSDLIKVFKNYGYDNCFSTEFYDFLKSSLLPIIKRDKEGSVISNQYALPNIDEFRGKKVAIYGAGVVGNDIYNQFQREKDIEVICFADKYTSRSSINGIPILSPKELIKIDFDIVLIAVQNEIMAETIKKELDMLGVDFYKLWWMKPIRMF